MITTISTPDAPAAIGPYAQAVAHGGVLYCSGQIALDPVSGTIVEGDVAAQARQKHYYDKGRSRNPDFPVGALVYLSSEHYRLSPETSKVEPRWLGPFPVLERVGELNYRLQLPSYMKKVHDVFHCSVLKAHVPQTAFEHPPPAVPVLNPPAALELILGHRRVRGGAYTFSVKLLDQPLPNEVVWLKEQDARAISPEVVAAYKAAHNI